MKTVHSPTTEKFERHLKGEYPAMGIVPINDDDECIFGAIDIDVYPLDHKITKNIQKKKFPLIMCLSKSGGAHLYSLQKKKLLQKNYK